MLSFARVLCILHSYLPTPVNILGCFVCLRKFPHYRPKSKRTEVLPTQVWLWPWVQRSAVKSQSLEQLEQWLWVCGYPLWVPCYLIAQSRGVASRGTPGHVSLVQCFLRQPFVLADFYFIYHEFSHFVIFAGNYIWLCGLCFRKNVIKFLQNSISHWASACLTLLRGLTTFWHAVTCESYNHLSLFTAKILYKTSKNN